MLIHDVHINFYPENTFSLLEASTKVKEKVKETESDDG